MEKMLDLFKEPVEIQDLPNAKPLVMAKGDVVFGKRRSVTGCMGVNCRTGEANIFGQLIHHKK